MCTAIFTHQQRRQTKSQFVPKKSRCTSAVGHIVLLLSQLKQPSLFIFFDLQLLAFEFGLVCQTVSKEMSLNRRTIARSAKS
jgi:hypothetical protein